MGVPLRRGEGKGVIGFRGFTLKVINKKLDGLFCRGSAVCYGFSVASSRLIAFMALVSALRGLLGISAPLDGGQKILSPGLISLKSGSRKRLRFWRDD